MIKQQVGEEWVHMAYTSLLLFITKGSQDRDSNMWDPRTENDAEAKTQ